MEELLLQDKPYIEYLDGKAYPKGLSRKATHSIVQGAALTILRRCSAGIGITGTEWDFRLGIADGTQTMFVPDVAVLMLERLRSLPESEREQPPFAPDVAVEVRSPSYRPAFAAEKVVRYLRTGAVLVLDVDPIKRLMFAHSAAGVLTFGEGDRFTHEAAPWLSFDVAELFGDLDLLMS
jgi:Uma2 family endonuclease